MPKVAGGVFERIRVNGRTQFKPIEGARVVFLEVGNPSNSAFTDTGNDGRYTLNLPAGNFDTAAAKQGYETFHNINRPGHSVLRENGRVHVNNFFLEPDLSVPDVIVRKQATLDAIIHLPEEGDGKTVAKRDIGTEITFNVTKGTMDVADIPDFRNESGIAFEASVNSEEGSYSKQTRNANLTIDAVLDPDSGFFGGDAHLRDVALSTQTKIGSFEGSPLNRENRKMILVGKTRSDQPGFPALLNNKPMIVKLIVELDDVDELV